jgi:hypothetical protein
MSPEDIPAAPGFHESLVARLAELDLVPADAAPAVATLRAPWSVAFDHEDEDGRVAA